MSQLKIALAVALLGPAAQAADDIPPHILNLARIQRLMADQLKRQPNYTCLETIDRYQGEKTLKPVDRIRIQVALADGRELYAWPGAKSFDERSLTEMVHSGFMSDGDFAAMARNLFVGRTAVVKWAGPETVKGRDLLRYDFRIAQMMSGWTVRLRGATGPVGVSGSFWADAKTLELVRMSFSAEELPPFSTDKTLTEDVVYNRVRLGESEILLPASVDIASEAFNAERRWNHATFTQCRRYGAESTISFSDDDPALPTASAAAAAEPVALPSGREIHLRLETAIDSAHVAVGDEIRATLVRDLRVEKDLSWPRGTVATGVVRMFERHTGSAPYYEVGLEFNALDSADRKALFVASLDRVTPFPGYRKNAVGFDDLAPVRALGVGYFYVEGTEVRIPKGTIFSFTTRELRTH